MRGRRPSPLDDSGVQSGSVEASKAHGASPGRQASAARLAAATVGTLRSRRGACDIFASQRHADVAELVDAHGSGPCLGDQVEVRVLSSASTDAHIADPCGDRSLGDAPLPAEALLRRARAHHSLTGELPAADGLSRTKTAAGVAGGRFAFAVLDVVLSSAAGVTAVAALRGDERETHARQQ
jgi:hypothetical protein